MRKMKFTLKFLVHLILILELYAQIHSFNVHVRNAGSLASNGEGNGKSTIEPKVNESSKVEEKENSTKNGSINTPSDTEVGVKLALPFINRNKRRGNGNILARFKDIKGYNADEKKNKYGSKEEYDDRYKIGQKSVKSPPHAKIPNYSKSHKSPKTNKLSKEDEDRIIRLVYEMVMQEVKDAIQNTKCNSDYDRISYEDDTNTEYPEDNMEYKEPQSPHYNYDHSLDLYEYYDDSYEKPREYGRGNYHRNYKRIYDAPSNYYTRDPRFYNIMEREIKPEVSTVIPVNNTDNGFKVTEECLRVNSCPSYFTMIHTEMYPDICSFKKMYHVKVEGMKVSSDHKDVVLTKLNVIYESASKKKVGMRTIASRNECVATRKLSNKMEYIILSKKSLESEDCTGLQEEYVMDFGDNYVPLNRILAQCAKQKGGKGRN